VEREPLFDWTPECQNHLHELIEAKIFEFSSDDNEIWVCLKWGNLEFEGCF